MKRFTYFLIGLALGVLFGYATGEKATPPQIPQTEITEYVAEETESEFVSLGMFTATAYDACYDCSGIWGNLTSTGVTATAGRTIAVDPTEIPYGTHLWINGHEYIAEDTGEAIKGKIVDIYFDTHEEAKQWGRQQVEVFVKR